MGETSNISWTHATFNPWMGCSRVSPGCTNCYAEAFVTKRMKLPVWGVNADRKPMSEAYWRQPIKWNRDAERAGERRRVFCASMADVFEVYSGKDPGPALVQETARERLWRLIEQTPRLDWLLLTKRPENVGPLVPWACETGVRLPHWPSNVWLGVTAEDQKRADERIPILLRIPARVRFVSYEPALGPVDFTRIVTWRKQVGATELAAEFDALRGFCGATEAEDTPSVRGLQWVIVGGESGPKARPFDLAWARSTVRQCKDAGTACFVKQTGLRVIGDVNDQLWAQRHTAYRRWILDDGSEWVPPIIGERAHAIPLNARGWVPEDSHGGDMEAWPMDLRVREFPR